MAETDQDKCVSIEELTKHIVGTAALTKLIVGTVAEQATQASKTVIFAWQGGHGVGVGHGAHDLGHEGLDHIGGTGSGGTGALDMNKTVERDGVGGIEMRNCIWWTGRTQRRNWTGIGE